MEEGDFIAYELDSNEESLRIAELLRRTVEELNKGAKATPDFYRLKSGNDVEELVCNAMRVVAPDVRFYKEIELVSGQSFPDIILRGTQYGVEVKSTKQDSWRTIGSSIMENTHNAGVCRIYLMFAKLGGTPHFRCRPYHLCLSDISVTHSPRYAMDMTLGEGDDILSKMGTNYNAFQMLDDGEKASKFMRFYIARSRKTKKREMPWWVGGAIAPTLSLYRDLDSAKKNELKCRAYVLFRCLYGNDNRERFNMIALWLCTRHSLLCHSMRDEFTAGGKCKVAKDGVDIEVPHFVKELLDNWDLIKRMLTEPDDELLSEIFDYWDFPYDKNNLLESWLQMVEVAFRKNSRMSHVLIRSLLR